MTCVLLFCIAEEAKSFVREALEPKAEQGRIFYLVESQKGPEGGERSGFKKELKDGETFETDFIGATVEDCQKWALEMMRKYNFIYNEIIAIVDARSAKDATISMRFYNERDSSSSPVRLDFGDFGILPPEDNAWYDFRIEHEYAGDVLSQLGFVTITNSFPVYFGRKEELTDERGVFDVGKARRLVAGEDPATFGLAEKDPVPKTDQ